MRIIYVANIRIPTNKAHGIQITNTCNSLAKLGIEVELLVPTRTNSIKKDLFEYYDLGKSFRVTYLPSLDLLGRHSFNKAAFIIQAFSFLLSALFWMSRNLKKGDVIYGRDEFILAPMSLFSKNIFWETHLGQINVFARTLLHKSLGVVCISRGLLDFYASKGRRNGMLLAPDAVDVDKFNDVPGNALGLRQELGLPKGKIVTYSGSDNYSWKGVGVFLNSFAHIEDDSVHYLLVGVSHEEGRRYLETKYDKIVFTGHVSPSLVPKYLKASDILVIPNTSDSSTSERFTSPMKMFEYMASGRAVVAADLPSIREILSDETAVFFKAGDSVDLARQLANCLRMPEFLKEKAIAALKEVSKYTWEKRGELLKNFIEIQVEKR